MSKGKRCTKCGEEKPREEFGRHKRSPDGLQTNCKACRIAYNKAYYAANQGRLRELAQRNRESKPDVIKARKKAYYLANKERLNARSKAHYWANRESVLQYERERRIQKGPAYAEENRDRRYGLAPGQWDVMFEEQGRCCRVCGSKEPGGKNWATDHDHSCCPSYRSCGKCVRGILCTGCNSAEGHLKSDPAAARALADYLESWIEKRSA